MSCCAAEIFAEMLRAIGCANDGATLLHCQLAEGLQVHISLRRQNVRPSLTGQNCVAIKIVCRMSESTLLPELGLRPMYRINE
jgi:hypothetical protein